MITRKKCVAFLHTAPKVINNFATASIAHRLAEPVYPSLFDLEPVQMYQRCTMEHSDAKS